MLEFAAFTYTFLAGFVLSSAGRNQRQRRPHPRPLVLAGWMLMSMSFTLTALLLSWALILLTRGG